MIITDFIRNFDRFHRAGTALELLSGPGVGKSSSMYAGAAALSRLLKEPVGVVTVILSQLEAVDIRGFLFPVKDEDELWARFTRPTIFPNKWNTIVYVDGKVVKDYWQNGGAMPHYGVLFLDEFGQADMEVQKPTGQLLLEKTIGEVRLGDGWNTWSASNRIEDRSGVVKRASFLQNRMKSLPMVPHLPSWEDWAFVNNVHPLGVSFAHRHPDHLLRDFVPKEPGPFCTFRSLTLCVQDLMEFRDKSHGEVKLPDDHIAIEIAEGWLGSGTAAIFMSHCRLANDLPEISDVAKNPKTAKIPERIDARYVMASTLPYHLDRKNGAAFITYMSRPQMDKELQILFVTAAIRRSPEALNHPEMQKWVAENNHLALIAFG